MRVNQPFLQLPVMFCADTLAAEVEKLPQSAWQPHPTGFVGNEAVRLVTPSGEPTDALRGPMAPTENLLACPYLMEIMAELGGVWGRSRLMGLGPGADVPSHVDVHYYWHTHLRIHIPITTNSGVHFTCDDETVHMAKGECWVFDSFRRHSVQNLGDQRRVHLVLDTVGGEHLWDLIEAAHSGAKASAILVPGTRREDRLDFEKLNSPKVMSPWEMRCHFAFLAEQVVPHPMFEPVMKRLDRFVCVWASAWARFGASDEGLPTFRQLVASIREELRAIGGGEITLENGRSLYFAMNQLILANATGEPVVPAAGAPRTLAAGQSLGS